MSHPYPSIKFVSPCCHTPIDIKNLDEIVVEQHGPYDEGDRPSYGIKGQCCGSLYPVPEAITPSMLQQFKEAVYKASIDAALAKIKARHKSELEAFWDAEVVRFKDDHDPSAERVWVSAIWGQNGTEGVANHRTSDDDSEEKCKAAMESKANWLLAQGYAEEQPTEDEIGTLRACRKFRKADQVRFTGYWTCAVSNSWGGSNHCEAAYLMTH